MSNNPTSNTQPPTSSDVVISLSNVSKYYKLYKTPNDRLKEALSYTGKEFHKKFYATNSLNLEIKKGEIVGIVGRNGSGKSTLLKLISSVLTPDKGKINVKGEISALLELGSGFNPQFTGLENIFFYGSVLGYSKKEMDEKLNDILAFAEIGDFIHQPIKTYSSGMKARLAFAVAVHIEPDILILDEVLSVGDVLFKRKSYAKMHEFFESGKTIIYVSHNTNEVNRLCTRAIFLLDGEIVMDGDTKTVTKYYEKYLFAKKNNQSKIKEEIKSYSWDKHQKNNIIQEEKNSSDNDVFSTKKIENSPKIINSNKEKPFFIPDFISKNRVEYDNTHLDIFDICIKTMAGDKVNALVINERYRYCYKLKFKDEFFNVGFGIQIHNEKGIVISGCGSRQCSPPITIGHVKKGNVVNVEWEFDCLMHQGIYYTKQGCNTFIDGEKKVINRIMDALVFKVLSSKSCCSGLVTLNQSKPSIEFIS